MTRFIIVVCFVLISSCSFAQDAGTYLDVIGQQFQKISHEMMTYTSAVNHGKSARKVEKRRTELMQQIKQSEMDVRKLKAFNGTTTLRDSMSTYFRMTGILLNHDYGKIVNMEEIAEQSYDAMEAYLLAKERAEAKLEAVEDNARVQYEAFASANNIKLIKGEDTELTKKMAQTSRVTRYANKTYLLFFKSYKNESYLMDAVKKNDIPAVEQARNALATSANEDLEKMKEVEVFDGDASLRSALQQSLLFYKNEAVAMKAEADFSIAKENFEKIKKSIEATPPAKRTQENINAYNKAVEDFNKQINAYNANNQDMNKKRHAALDAWNDTYDKFLDKHTPKYK